MEQENIDPHYKKGFEQGYWLERGNRPELKQHIKDAEKNMPYAQGLKAGSKEATKEKFKTQITESSKEKDKGMEIG